MKFFLVCFCVLFLFGSCGKQKNTKLADTYFKMGFFEVGQDPEADQACKRALAYVDQALAQDQRAEYHAFRATLLFKLGDSPNSEESFKKALSLAPTQDLRAEIMNNYACLLPSRGKIAQAQEIWKALAQNTAYQTPEVALVNLGKTYVQVKDYATARELFNKAVRLSPSYVDAHFYLASADFELGQHARAQQELDTVLALEPEHYGAQGLAQNLKKA